MSRQLDYILVENTGRRSHGRPICRLARPLHYIPSDPRLPRTIVPDGTEVDFASVPRVFWRIAAPWDALEPAAVHDYRCRYRISRKKLTDRVFLCAMKDYGVIRWRRVLMYLAVRAFGWICYPSVEEANK